MNDKKLLALVKRAARGDADAFSRILEIKGREVLYLCVSEMRNQQDGEDAAQEVFIQMHHSIGRLRAPEAFNVWLNRLIHFTCAKIKRRSMNKNEIPWEDGGFDALMDDVDPQLLPQNFVESSESRRLISEMVDALPDKYRTCVVLHYYQGLSYRQVASVLNITTDAVNNNLRLARKHLKVEMEEAFGTGAHRAVGSMISMAAVLNTIISEHAAIVATPKLVGSCLTAAGFASAGAAVTAGTAASAAGAAASAAAAGIGAKATVAITLATVLTLGSTSAAVGMLAPELFSPLSSAVSVYEDDGTLQNHIGMDVAAYAISGRLYLDGAGLVDEDARLGMAGVTLELVEEDDPGTVLQSVQTSADGSGGFLLVGEAAGNYRLRVRLPLGTRATGGNTGFDENGGWLLVNGQPTLTLGGSNYTASGLELELNVPAIVEGELLLSAEGTQPASHIKQLSAALMVLLVDPQGKTVASTGVDDSGSYCFENPVISQTGTYTIRIQMEDGTGGNLEMGETAIKLYPGYGAF